MKRTNERGQILPLIGISLAVLMGFAGIGVDVGYLEYRQQAQQTATDESSAVQPESQSVNSIGRPSNQAQANSPQFREEHPVSDRIAISGDEAKAKAERIKKQMDKLKENVAWAASPRTREEFPELQRVPLSLEEQQAKAERIKKQMDKLKENAAWAASPRTREEFPELR